MGAVTSHPTNRLRQSIRLPAHDYADPGAYFVTICTNDRRYLFGEVVADKMRLNAAGLMVARWWREVLHKFPLIQLDAYIVMPNHPHGIVVITSDVGAALRGRPGHPHRGAPTLGDIVDWFKTMTTSEYIRHVKSDNWPAFPGKVWQRNYYERVIRDEEELGRIREYVLRNPAQWALDRENSLALHDPERWSRRPNRDAIESLFFL